MIRRLVSVLLGLPWLALACATPPGPSPTTVVPTSPAPAVAPAWEAEWDQLVAAATAEGRIVVAGPAGEPWSRLATSFQQEFPGIDVDYTGVSTDDFYARLFQERQAGVYAWDARLGTLEAEVYRGRDVGALVPVRPMLFHGLVVDDSRWVAGLDGLFGFDREYRWFPGFFVQITPSAWVNRGTVDAGDLKSARDLLDPRWRRKIVLLDPRRDSGLGAFTLLLNAYGEGFLRDLVERQEAIVTGDAREQADWVIRGEYSVGVGYTTDLARRFLLQGVIVPVQPLPDGPIGISPGDGALQAIDRPPHPHAQRLFANWLLTAPVQESLAAAVGANSRRTDAQAGDPLLRPDPRFLDQFVCHVCEDMLPVRAEALRLARELIR